MAERLRGKVAIVTGAGRGIGAAIAERFAVEGAAVVIAERDAETGAAMADKLRRAGCKALFVETDVTGEASVEGAARTALSAFGRVDILVNNAGINVFHPPHKTSDEEWRRCFAVDLDGVWRMTKAVLPFMRAARGRARSSTSRPPTPSPSSPAAFPIWSPSTASWASPGLSASSMRRKGCA